MTGEKLKLRHEQETVCDFVEEPEEVPPEPEKPGKLRRRTTEEKEIDLEKAGRTTLLKIIACTTRRMARAAEMNPDIKRLLSFGIWCFLLGACIGITVVTVLVGKGQQINWGSAPGILVSGLATAYAFYRKLGTEPGPLARKIQRDMHKKNVNEVGVTLQER